MVEVLGFGDNLLDLSKAKLNLNTEDTLECEDKNCLVHRHHHRQNPQSSKFENTFGNSSKRSSLLRLDDVSDLQLDYKSGAVYNGKICDNLKYGKGTFTWPNGDKYIGEFKVNFRHGFGMRQSIVFVSYLCQGLN